MASRAEYNHAFLSVTPFAYVELHLVNEPTFTARKPIARQRVNPLAPFVGMADFMSAVSSHKSSSGATSSCRRDAQRAAGDGNRAAADDAHGVEIDRRAAGANIAIADNRRAVALKNARP